MPADGSGGAAVRRVVRGRSWFVISFARV